MPYYARFRGNNYLQVLSEVELNQRFEYGYDEIAQNITVFSDSKIALCRDINKIPAVVNGNLQSSIRVEYILNPGNESYPITDNMLDYNIWLNAILCMRFKISPLAQLIVNHSPAELVSCINLPNLTNVLSFT